MHFCPGGIGCDKGADAKDCSRRDWDYLLGRTNQEERNAGGEILKKSCDHPGFSLATEDSIEETKSETTAGGIESRF